MDASRENFAAPSFAQILLRQRGVLFLSMAVVLTADLCWIVYGPRSYESVATLYVRAGRELGKSGEERDGNGVQAGLALFCLSALSQGGLDPERMQEPARVAPPLPGSTMPEGA
jgi:hypothetical protein